MPGKPKLIYFDFGGRAEATRLTFYVGGVDFDDVRISGEEFSQNKQAGKYPFGQVPVLEVDGKVVAQSLAHLHYAGLRGKLYPTDPVQALLVDEVVFTTEDMIIATVPSLKEQDPGKRSALRKELAETGYPKFLGPLEKNLAATGGKSPYFVDDKLTIADLAAYSVLSWFKSGTLDGIPTTLLDPYPHLSKLIDTVAAHPKVKEWQDKHAKK